MDVIVGFIWMKKSIDFYVYSVFKIIKLIFNIVIWIFYIDICMIFLYLKNFIFLFKYERWKGLFKIYNYC